MSNKTKIIYNGVSCWFVSFHNSIQGFFGGNTCPICNNNLEDGGLYLIINNYVLFPNVFIHKDCIDKPDETVVEYLKLSYEKAKKHYDSIVNTAWFKWIGENNG